jgi:hypothetical protein
MSAEAGGIDFGHANTRALIDQLFAGNTTLAAKLKGLGEQLTSIRKQLGLPNVGPHHISYARSLSNG